MAYREVDMWEILDVLRRFHRQESKAAIKRATGRTRKTIRRYVATARALGWKETTEPTEALAVAVARKLKPVPETPLAHRRRRDVPPGAVQQGLASTP